MSQTRVYQYGCKPPFENSDIVHQQLWLAHRYRNTLVEIECTRRAMVRDVVAADPDVRTQTGLSVAAAARTVNALKALNTARAEERKRIVDPVLVENLNDARKAERKSLGLLYAARNAAMRSTDIGEMIRLYASRAKELRIAARETCNVYWGTYLLIEDEMDASAKMPLWDGLDDNNPRFQRFTGEGRVGVQIQKTKSMSGAQIGVTDTRFRIEPLSNDYQRPERTGKRGDQRRVLAMRIGSDLRAPVWARWRVTVHRPVPPEAQIKRAVVHHRKIGPRSVWLLDVTLDVSAVPQPKREDDGVVAVDVGWRKIGNEIRVAVWQDDDGKRGELRLPERLIEQLRYHETLRSIRDDALDTVRAKLMNWLSDAQNVPQWLRERTQTLARWKSQERLAQLVVHWRVNRFVGDEKIFEQLDGSKNGDGGWRYHDHHMWEWERSQQMKALAHRKDLFRVFAASLAKTHRTLILEDFNLNTMARRPTETDDGNNENARSNRQMVAVSEFRESMINAFRVRAGEALAVNPAHTTHDCSAVTVDGTVCGHRNTWNQDEEIRYKCEKCGISWDQDENAAANLLTRYFEHPDDAKQAGIARKSEKSNDSAVPGETRWARAKRLQRERKEMGETARNKRSGGV